MSTVGDILSTVGSVQYRGSETQALVSIVVIPANTKLCHT